MAIEYGYRLRDQNPNAWVFWIHASNLLRYKQSTRDVATMIKLPGHDDDARPMHAPFRDWLRSAENGSWLMILDNVDDPEFLLERAPDSGKSLYDFLPVCDHGTIVVTSRNKHAAAKLVGWDDIIEVKAMERTHAVTLLSRRLGTTGISDDTSELAEVLDNMPLALSQAAAYIKQMGSRGSVRHYLDQLESKVEGQHNILDLEADDHRRDAEACHAILQTWQISFEHLRQVRPSAADLLSLMSFCDRQAIPDHLLCVSDVSSETITDRDKRKATLGIGTSSQGTVLPEGDAEQQAPIKTLDTGWLDPSRAEFDHDIATLESYMFISVTKDDASTFEMHRLVQLATQKWLKSQGQYEKWKERFVLNLSAKFPVWENQNIDICRSLYPHVKVAMSLQLHDPTARIHLGYLMSNAGKKAIQYLPHGDSMKMLDHAVDIFTAELRDDHPITLESAVHRATAYREHNLLDEAEAIATQALQECRQALGDQDTTTVLAMTELATIYEEQGQFQNAEFLYHALLRLRQEKLGMLHSGTMLAAMELVRLYNSQGRFDVSHRVLLTLFEYSRAHDGEASLATLGYARQLMYNSWQRGDMAEVEKMGNFILNAAAQPTNDEELMIVLCASDLLRLIFEAQRRLGDLAKLTVAIKARECAISRSRNSHRMQNERIHKIASLARDAWNRGRKEEAIRLQQAAARISREQFGVDHETSRDMAETTEIYNVAARSFLEKITHTIRVKFRRSAIKEGTSRHPGLSVFTKITIRP